MDTHGTGVLHHLYHTHKPYMGAMPNTRRGVLVSTSGGIVTEYALGYMEPRGTRFVLEGTTVYEGGS